MTKCLLSFALIAVLLAGCAVPPVVGTEQSSLRTEFGSVSTAASSEPTEHTQPTVTTEPTQPTEPEKPPFIPPAVEAKEPADSDMVRVKDYIPDVAVELKYATEDNISGKVVYEFTEAYLRYGTVKKLARVQETLKTHGLSLKIWDAYRPVYGQYRLWDACPDPTYVSRPDVGVRAHCRGHAADITLTDAGGNDLEMPTGFDNFTALADRDYADCTPEAAENAKLLEDIMLANGFYGYSKEWWHYVDYDDYPLETTVDPAVVSLWYASCNQSMSLRKAPDTTSASIRSIGRGEVMTLLGWDGKFAYVDYAGYRGYVLANYILPAEQWTSKLSVVKATTSYSYDTLCTDMVTLSKQYPESTRLTYIGASENGRQIPVLVVGKPESENQILLQAGIHGREHMTCWLLMAMTELWLAEGRVDAWDVCFHILPMTNPDGVTISQAGKLPADLEAVYANDIQKKYTNLSKSAYAAQWKANAKGVDLNRNFDMGWNAYQGRPDPSSECYKGEAPFSAAEAKALRDYTLAYDLDATVSYHASGSIQYIGDRSQTLAREITFVTGYAALSAAQTDAAGYRDWAEGILKIPSVTVEIGSFAAPLAERELESLLARNAGVLKALAKWVLIK